MMQVFRSFFGKVAAGVFAVLMLVFLLTSVDWSQVTGGSRSSVGEINGTKVPLQLYQQATQQALTSRQQQLGRSLSEEEAQAVRDEVWDQMVQQQALEAQYKARHISVSADEIAAAIQDNPPPELTQQDEFKTDGRFDLTKYQRWLRSSAAAQYVPILESQYGEQIRQSKLLRVVTADLYLSDAALWQRWRDDHETATVELAALIPGSLVADSQVSVTETEVRKYFDDHQDEFRHARTALLSYVQLSRLPEASDSAAALSHAQELRKELVGGAPFAEVATRESADTASTRQGGLMPDFGKDAVDPAIERAGFSLPIGALSEPILAQDGYHLLKVESRTGGKVHARHILVPIDIVGAHRDLLDARADSLEALAAEKLDGAALDTAARALGLNVGKANPLLQGGRVQVGFQVIPDAGLWAFQAQVGETSRIIETSYAYFLFRVDSLIPEGVPPFDQIRSAVETATRDHKKWDKAREIGKELVARVNGGATLAQAASAMHIPHQTVGPFTRISPAVPGARLAGAAFGVEVGKTSGVIEEQDGLYVLSVLSRNPGDRAEFTKQLPDYRARQVRLAQQDRVRNYLEALKASAKVTDRRSQIFRTEAQAQQATQGRQKS